jgi:hypothetical protein
LSRSWFHLLLDFGTILTENWVGSSNARTVNWKATDYNPLAHVELQTVLEPFTGASCHAVAHFELLLDIGQILAENWVELLQILREVWSEM